MAQDVERLAARLATLSRADLLNLAVQGCHESAAFRCRVDSQLTIAAHRRANANAPAWPTANVLSLDLAREIFESLEVREHTVALVCKRWTASTVSNETPSAGGLLSSASSDSTATSCTRQPSPSRSSRSSHGSDGSHASIDSDTESYIHYRAAVVFDKIPLPSRPDITSDSEPCEIVRAAAAEYRISDDMISTFGLTDAADRLLGMMTHPYHITMLRARRPPEIADKNLARATHPCDFLEAMAEEWNLENFSADTKGMPKPFRVWDGWGKFFLRRGDHRWVDTPPASPSGRRRPRGWRAEARALGERRRHQEA